MYSCATVKVPGLIFLSMKLYIVWLLYSSSDLELCRLAHGVHKYTHIMDWENEIYYKEDYFHKE